MRWGRTPRLQLQECGACRTLWPDEPLPGAGSRPWSEHDITPEFTRALQMRRDLQASQLLERFHDALGAGPVLDYGCGQGAFLSRLLEKGHEAWGCDLSSPTDSMARRAGERFSLLPEPWATPRLQPPGGRWAVLCLLDVLEHHPEPWHFVTTLPDSRYLLIKVPLRTGPLSLGASTLARLGRPSLLETLFLVNDAAPHQVFFTARGLEAMLARAGWRLRDVLSMPDVGTELPERLRGSASASSRSPVLKPAIRVMGSVVAFAAHWWSDTAAFLFERSTPPST